MVARLAILLSLLSARTEADETSRGAAALRKSAFRRLRRPFAGATGPAATRKPRPSPRVAGARRTIGGKEDGLGAARETSNRRPRLERSSPWLNPPAGADGALRSRRPGESRAGARSEPESPPLRTRARRGACRLILSLSGGER